LQQLSGKRSSATSGAREPVVAVKKPLVPTPGRPAAVAIKQSSAPTHVRPQAPAVQSQRPARGSPAAPLDPHAPLSMSLEVLNKTGADSWSNGNYSAAFMCFRRATEVAPDHPQAFLNLGFLLWDVGDLDSARRMFERSAVLTPSVNSLPHHCVMALLNYRLDVDAQFVYEAHRCWAERLCHEVGEPYTDWMVQRTVGRPLRIAYISPDLMHHSVSFFAHCLLENHDRNMFHVFVYSNSGREDDKTALFRRMLVAERWKMINHLSAREAANLIRADQIDLLIDLTGLTKDNRLDVLALKPAPVQFTYCGYPNTTGLGTIDYRISDSVADPPGTSQAFSEELVRLPGCFLCYTPPAVLPDVGQLPALRGRCVMFGSFSNLAKVNAACVALWARVLREVPGSHLLVKAKGFKAPEVREHFAKLLASHGVAGERLHLVPLTPDDFQHLNTYNDVDIALDTFPYSNTTTTCEALIMGVPTICLRGNTHCSRTSATLLTGVGLSQFVANGHDEFVSKAAAFAGDLARLSSIRRDLRSSMLASTLCNAPRFVRDDFEPVLKEKWQIFCEGRPPSMQAAARASGAVAEPRATAPPGA